MKKLILSALVCAIPFMASAQKVVKNENAQQMTQGVRPGRPTTTKPATLTSQPTTKPRPTVNNPQLQNAPAPTTTPKTKNGKNLQDALPSKK